MDMRYERFSTPLLGKSTIKRQAITEQIDCLSRRSILFIHSPAGYGKTTAAALWANGKNVVWLSLDEYSSEPVDIYRWLLFALSCEITERFANAPVEFMLRELERLENWPQALIIDDFHLCSDSSVAQTLSSIRLRMPQNTAFIIISRNPPPNILIEQTIKGTVNQISDLQLSDDEIISLFNKNNLQITKSQATLINRQTDGWVAALAAIILSSKELSSDILNSEALNNYLRTHVFDYWDNYNVLKKCSVCDILNEDLCSALTGENNAWEIISKLADKTGLVVRLNHNTYRFHVLLKEFLESELMLDESIDKFALYKVAAQHFKNRGEIIRALDMAAKSRDVAMIEEYLRARSDEYGKFDADIAGYTSAILKYVYSEIPASTIKQSLRLSLDCFNTLLFLGMLPESFEWIDAAEELLWSRQNTRTDIIGTALLVSIDPRRNVWDIPMHFHKIMPILPKAHPSKMTSISLTVNFPFFHKAQVDYSEISPQLDDFIVRAEEYMAPIMGQLFEPLILLLEAGLRYERGELAQAEKIAEKSVQIMQRFPLEIQFSSLALYSEIKRTQGKNFVDEIDEAMTVLAKAPYLSANINAVATTIKLHSGDVNHANCWLSQTEVESNLKFYKIYQYFTTARALIVVGKICEAEKLLEKLITFSLAYRRASDYIEALTLQSICFWHMKRLNDSLNAMTIAICKAFELQLIMPIAKEGGDVLPILKKIINRLRCGYGVDRLNKSFVNKLFFSAQTLSEYTGIMVARIKNKLVKLSPRQMEILGYLEQNLSYKEISAKIGIKVSTVDDHIRKLYEKLEVSNSHSAIIKARELGIYNT